MRFWDTSAVVTLLIEEPPFSRHYRGLYRVDPRMGVWFFTRTEAISAIRAYVRAGLLNTRQLDAAEDELARLMSKWTELDVASLRLRDEANRLLRAYTLRTLDALQLATALVAFGKPPRRRGFVTKDKALAKAAAAEGFEVL